MTFTVAFRNSHSKRWLYHLATGETTNIIRDAVALPQWDASELAKQIRATDQHTEARVVRMPKYQQRGHEVATLAVAA